MKAVCRGPESAMLKFLKSMPASLSIWGRQPPMRFMPCSRWFRKRYCGRPELSYYLRCAFWENGNSLPDREDHMDVIILTGMSGAGKSQAANYLEDMGYFCIDNLPPNLLPELVRSFARSAGNSFAETAKKTRLAMVVDVRSSELFD